MKKANVIDQLSKLPNTQELIKKYKKLTETHRDVLVCVFQHGGWATELCGWLWSTPSYTLTVCKSLAKKGFLSEETYETTVGGHKTQHKFTPIVNMKTLTKAEINAVFEQLQKRY